MQTFDRVERKSGTRVQPDAAGRAEDRRIDKYRGDWCDDPRRDLLYRQRKAQRDAVGPTGSQGWRWN